MFPRFLSGRQMQCLLNFFLFSSFNSVDWLIGRSVFFIDQSINWLIDYLSIDWLIVFLLIDWLIDCFSWLIDWLIDCFFDCSIWLIDWLIKALNFCLFVGLCGDGSVGVSVAGGVLSVGSRCHRSKRYVQFLFSLQILYFYGSFMETGSLFPLTLFVFSGATDPDGLVKRLMEDNSGADPACVKGGCYVAQSPNYANLNISVVSEQPDDQTRKNLSIS